MHPNRNGTTTEPSITTTEPFSAGANAPAADGVETELQVACRETWNAYRAAYELKYGVKPLRNAKVNANVKELVKRIGRNDAPLLAAWYVANVRDAYVVRMSHDMATLLSGAESYYTQWQRGQALTHTAAKELDQNAAQADAIEQAAQMAISARKGNHAQ